MVPLLTLILLSAAAEPLPGTRPLRDEGDLAARMVAGIDDYLIRELKASVEARQAYWKPDFSSPEAYTKSVQPNRDRLARILGVVEKRLPLTELEYVATDRTPAMVGGGPGYTVYAVRWRVLEGIDAEGLLLKPDGEPVAHLVAVPDADWTPEMVVGLAPGLQPEDQFARVLAEMGCQVLVPTLINRQDTFSGNPKVGRMTNQPHREFVYRMAYEMGRHVIGYEVQKVLAAVDWFARAPGRRPIGVYGAREGGLLALYSAALDTRIQAAVVAGYFGPREMLWREPIYRNVWGLLREFGDAELAMLVVPRNLIVYGGHDLDLQRPPPPVRGRSGAAPGLLWAPLFKDARAELERGRNRLAGFPGGVEKRLLAVEGRTPPQAMLRRFFFEQLGVRPGGKRNDDDLPPRIAHPHFDRLARQQRQLEQMVAHTQKLMRDSEQRRREAFWSKIDTSSVEQFEASCRPFRTQFWEEIIGKLPAPDKPMNPRSRLAYEEPKWKGYEVTLDLYPDVFAYGILLVPKDLKPGERRPVVVCQHGLEGRPQDVVNPKEKSRHYNSFGAQLADRGFVVFAPQNPYIGHDKFRVLQRKANPLGLSLFSFIVRQHERCLDWLATLPFVDPERIGFYGLSYGGKTAMRVPAILPRYCLSICSGDFNEWIWKNVSVDFPASYVFSGEYEMPEFNLGNTFNYAEMAALIAPRPFMVERGHDDGVGIDEWVAYEYAKVRRLYDRVGIPERTAIEFFNGGHQINGQGTFAFLEKHLRWQR